MTGSTLSILLRPPSKTPQVGRLAAIPCFFQSRDFWKGTLDPRTSTDDQARFGHFREFSSAHEWLFDFKGVSLAPAQGTELTVCELALAMLRRGAWAPSSWNIEVQLAGLMEDAGLARFTQFAERSGLLGFAATPADSFPSGTALISGRLASEVQPDAASQMWQLANFDSDVDGSAAERKYFEEVLVPVLGFPLLDFLRFQAPLSELGVNPSQFIRQRTDFSIDTGRGLRLVIEVDGRQHDEIASQRVLDRNRDDAVKASGWLSLRIPVAELNDAAKLRFQLVALIRTVKGATWCLGGSSEPARSNMAMTCVWGATVTARIQFLLLYAMHAGLLQAAPRWRLKIDEAETEAAHLAIEDFLGWFGRLRTMYLLPALPEIELTESMDDVDLYIDISCTDPYRAVESLTTPYACSRPANRMVQEPSFRFTERVYLKTSPTKDLLASFAQDLFRKRALREGQYEILCRVLMGHDAVGLLPTGGGKSLTYQLATLLLPGVTLYVAPLKSLLQDQFERMKADGIDCCGFLSSALTTMQRKRQEDRFASGRIRLLQVAPERFLMAGFRGLLDQYQAAYGAVTQVVIDECHCVSEWGHDFRPAYLSLSRIVRDRTSKLGTEAVVVALTGTASSIVLEDVKRELGILSAGAVVRAKKLDRPELELKFAMVNGTDKKPALVAAVDAFLKVHRSSSGGLLVFTQHVNGSLGVHDIAVEVAQRLTLEPGKDIRIYSGDRPKALKESMSSDDWESLKAQTQRAFISPRGDAFQILMATSAFGMGIDKPTIRQVIHYLAPQSPEAYYQEVGRAARDGEAAQALMLFSDEAAELTDTILSPNTDIEEARAQHKAIKFGVPQGDFLTTFFFHANRFTGVREEALAAINALKAMKKKVNNGEAVVLSYVPGKTASSWNVEGALEYSIVRLIHLGVVIDYTKNFNARTFEVALAPNWFSAWAADVETYRQHFLANLEEYVRRYEPRSSPSLLEKIRAALTFDDIESAALTAIVQYLYSQIERRRRTSTREMLEIIREGVKDQGKARQLLLFYLQASEKFTHALEQVALDAPGSLAWSQLAGSAKSPVEVDELRGAATRVLESYPTHPGLLFLSAITRRNPSDAEVARSREEFQAALSTLAEFSVDSAADSAEAALGLCAGFDGKLTRQLNAIYGSWSYRHFGPRFSMERAGSDVEARFGVFKEMLSVAQTGIPEEA